MNSENSKTSKPHVLILKLTNKLDWRIAEKIIALSNLSIYYKCKNIENTDTPSVQIYVSKTESRLHWKSKILELFLNF